MRIVKNLFQGIGFLLLVLIFTSCGRYNDISVKGVSRVQFRGLQQNVVLLNLDVEIDNPNTRKIAVTNIEFKAWLSGRELGDFRISESIKLIPCSRETYTVPVEIKLRTVADAFKLVSSGSIETLLERIEVEGIIKAKSFPVRKTIKVARQPFRKIAASL
ncbi:MAG: LEA type 2 family protein [Bacteroidales bacterium]|nr:LEA type 2 family protein [Bacteroidales bacterium]